MRISDEKMKRVLMFGNTLDKSRNVPEIERIAGLFPRGYMSIVASMAGTGKTWLMQYIACQLSCGGKILSGIVPKSPKYKTVILSGETGTTLLDIRLQKTCWSYDIDRIKVYSSIDMALEGLSCMLNTTEGQETLIAIIAQEKPDIVFFDTLISWHTLDESKQGEMTAIYMFLLKLCKAFDCAVVLNHHTRKRPANARNIRFNQEDVIGSSAGVRLASAVYIITTDEENHNNGMPTMTVHNVKAWDKKVPDFSYKFIEDDTTHLIDFQISFDTEGNNIFWSLRERLLALVKTYEAGAYLKPNEIATELKASADMARNYMDELVNKNVLQRVRIPGINGYLYQVMQNEATR